MASALLLTQGVGSKPDGFQCRAALFQASRVVDPSSFNRKDLQTPNKLRSPTIRYQPQQPILKVHDQVVTQLAQPINPATVDPSSYNKNDLQSFSQLKSPEISNPSNEKRYDYFHSYFQVDTNEGDALVVPNGFDAIVKGLTTKGYSQEFVNSFLSNLQFKQRSRLTAEQRALYDRLLGHHIAPSPPQQQPSAQPSQGNQQQRDDEKKDDARLQTPARNPTRPAKTPAEQVNEEFDKILMDDFIKGLNDPADPKQIDSNLMALYNQAVKGGIVSSNTIPLQSTFIVGHGNNFIQLQTARRYLRDGTHTITFANGFWRLTKK